MVAFVRSVHHSYEKVHEEYVRDKREGVEEAIRQLLKGWPFHISDSATGVRVNLTENSPERPHHTLVPSVLAAWPKNRREAAATADAEETDTHEKGVSVLGHTIRRNHYLTEILGQRATLNQTYVAW
jgi:hypothetical protein